MVARQVLRSGISLLAFSFCFSGVAYAQVSAPVAADSKTPEAKANETIVVTGTRLTSIGFSAPTPVTSIGTAEIQKAAPVTIADYVNQLPALSGSTTPANNEGSINAGTVGGNFLDLRNLGLNRTLVLLDGRRVTPSTLTGITDVNVLPTSLVKRVDIVTGGASSAWGSDAVAGVVNFVLDKDFIGVKGTVQGGMTSLADASNFSANLSFGKSFADGRGHILLSGDYSKQNPAYYRDRSWFKAYKVVPNPLAGQPGQTANLSAPYASLAATNTGLILSGPLKGYYFAPDGGLAGTNFPLTGLSSIYIYGDQSVYDRLADQSRNSQAIAPLERGSAFAYLSYDVAPNVTAFLEGSFAKSDSKSNVASYWKVGTITIKSDNFYLPTAVRSAMAAAGVTSFPLSIVNSKMGILQTRVARENYRGLAGLQGTFGSSWHWDASYQYGRTNSQIYLYNAPIVGQYNQAIDSVANPADPTQPICRSSLTNPSNGCVSMDPFGSQALTVAQLAYVTGISQQRLAYSQSVAAANIGGNLLELPAGPLSFASGAEYRKETAHATSDPISQANGFWAGNFKAFKGSYDVKEAYAEAGAPIFKNSSIGKSLNIDLAARLTHYSTSGSVLTWKAGGRYELTDGVEFRVTRSRDIRAPNLQELYTPGSVTTQSISDPFNGGASVQFLQTNAGNPALKPEKAKTLTLGLVLQPRIVPGLNVSVDYYNIAIHGAISTNSSQFIVNQCHAGVSVFCTAITRNSANMITAVTLEPFNALSQNARGLDVEGAYRHRIGAGSLELRALGNYVFKLETVTPFSVTEQAGYVGNFSGSAAGVPHFRGLAMVSYSLNPWTFQLKGRLIGAAAIDPTAGLSINHVPAIAYLDGYIDYKLKWPVKGAEVFFAVDNILNTAPPVVTPLDNANTIASGTNVSIYDVLGRNLRAGLRFQF